jgi:sugar transferase (PEP-CTERM system associated)
LHAQFEEVYASVIRVFRHYIPKSLVILGTCEAVILFVSVYLSVSLRLTGGFNPTDKLLVGAVWPKAALYTVLMLVALAGMGLYQRSLRDDLRGVLFRSSLALLLGLVAVIGVLYFVPKFYIGTHASSIAFLMSATGILIFRAVTYRFAESVLFKRRVLILGAGQMAAQVEQLRRKVDRQDMFLVGFVHVSTEKDVVSGRVLHVSTTLADLATENRVDEVVVAVEERRDSFPVEQILDCKMSGIRVIELATFFEQQTGKLQLDALNPSTLIFADGFVQAIVKGYVHRIFDIMVSVLLLMVVWPIMLLTAVAIWFESGLRGPILYRQERIGRNGRPFDVLKFRSMQTDAEKDGRALWATVDDTRVTRVGSFIRRTRIDELPQLINVLRGDMSFVGPRPERPAFVAELSERIPYYDLRHRVNPGITGWAQICYPYGSSEKDAREKLQFDLYYIKNYSLFLDITILIQTAQVILWGKGAR